MERMDISYRKTRAEEILKAVGNMVPNITEKAAAEADKRWQNKYEELEAKHEELKALHQKGSKKHNRK